MIPSSLIRAPSLPLPSAHISTPTPTPPHIQPLLTEVHCSSKVVNVGDEDELLALLEKLVEQTTPLQ